MRITNSMMISTYIKNLNKNYNAMNKLQTQISTGKRLIRGSDDPIAAAKAMGVRSSLLKVKQYSNNVTEAKELLGQTESSLNEMNSLLTRAYELATSSASESNGQEERLAIAQELEQISEQLVGSANSNFGSEYVFGGLNINQKPFQIKEISGKKVLFYNEKNLNELDEPANAADFDALKSQRINYEIGFGTSMDIAYNGIDVMGAGEGNIFAVLDHLVQSLKTGDEMVIKDSVGLVKNAQEHVVALLGELGSKTNRLEFFTTRLENDEYNYTIIQENTEGIELEKVLLDLKNRETVYEAALAAGAKIIVQTLADFLR